MLPWKRLGLDKHASDIMLPIWTYKGLSFGLVFFMVSVA